MKKQFKKLKRAMAAALALMLCLGMAIPGNVHAVESISGENSESTQPLLNYAYIDAPEVNVPGTQTILLGIGDGIQNIENAVLTYQKQESGEILSVNADQIVNDAVVFHVSYDSPQQAGVYKLLSVDYEIEGKQHSVSFAEAGLDLSYGVNTSIETSPDAIVEESEEEISAQVVQLDENGNTISSLSIEEAIGEAGADIPSALREGIDRNSAQPLNIVLDPGHDDTHAGAQGNGFGEEDLTLKIAYYCKTELEKYNNVKIFMVRDESGACPFPGTNSGQCNKQRTEFAKSVGANVYVSFHLNSASASARGAEVYYPNEGYNSGVHDQGKNLAQKILDQLVALGIKSRGIKIKDSESGSQYPDGSEADYYDIIKQNKLNGIPAVIIEHAFITSPEDVAQFLGSEEKLRQLAAADAQGIANAYSLSKYQPIYQWKMENGRYRCYLSGNLMINAWVTGDDGEIRCTDKDGYMVTNQFMFDGQYTYYLMANGAPMKDRMTYHPDGVHIIYFDEYGHEVFGNFQYSKNDNATYYFDSQGYIYKDQITFWNGSTYYLNADGKMEQNGWFEFANGRDLGYGTSTGALMNQGFSYDAKGRSVYFHWNGMVARGLISDGTWYYLMDETDGHLKGKFL